MTAGNPRTGLDVAAEVSIALVTAATVVSLLRVFENGSWLWILLAQVVLAHGAMTVGRRVGLGTAASAGVTVVLGLVVVTALYAGEDALAGVLPGPGALGHLGTDVSTSFAQFGDVKAPVPADDGFLIGCAGAVWLIAVLADWWAFRLRATVESVIPAAALFVVATILGADRHRAAHAGTFIGAVLLHILAGRARGSAREGVWVGTNRAHGPVALLRLGAVLAVAAATFGGLVAPRLPSATAEGAVDLRNLDGDDPGPRVTVSPLVDIRRRLVEQSDAVAFQVRSPVQAYWRLTSLDRFDGQIWSSNGSFGSADGDLDDGVPVDADRTVFDQQFHIIGLRQLWVPAAYEPQAITADEDLRYDEDSGTIIVGNDLNDSDDLRYTVTSALPVLEPSALAGASTEIPDGIAERYLPLPADFPADIGTLAQEVTAAGSSTYQKALLLQSWFRTEFTYSLEVPPSHGGDAMRSFLFETREGYCEQFAGTFAAMARSLGIPARVAVGFTPGEPAAGDPEVLTVRGANAHAWPELYLGEYGWVLFEPTPGRGAPGSESYTGVPAQQAERSNASATTAAPPTSTAPDDLTSQTTTVPTTSVAPADGSGDADTSPASPWPGRLLLTVAVITAVGLLYIGGVWAFDALRARRRRRRAATEAARIATAWEETLGNIRRIGIPTPHGETQAEFARRVGGRLPAAAAPLRELAGSTEALTFAPSEPPEGSGLRAFELADEIRIHVDATEDLRVRVRKKYDPLTRLRTRS